MQKYNFYLLPEITWSFFCALISIFFGIGFDNIALLFLGLILSLKKTLNVLNTSEIEIAMEIMTKQPIENLKFTMTRQLSPTSILPLPTEFLLYSNTEDIPEQNDEIRQISDTTSELEKIEQDFNKSCEDIIRELRTIDEIKQNPVTIGFKEIEQIVNEYCEMSSFSPRNSNALTEIAQNNRTIQSKENFIREINERINSQNIALEMALRFYKIKDRIENMKKKNKLHK